MNMILFLRLNTSNQVSQITILLLQLVCLHLWVHQVRQLTI